MRHISGSPLARGFTLIELMVVLAIIAIIAGLLIPAVQSAREASRRLQCANNLKQMGLAVHQYHDSWSVFPSAYADSLLAAQKTTVIHRSSFSTGWAWAAKLLPYVEQRVLYDAANFSVPYPVPQNHSVIDTTIAVFLCPSAASDAHEIDLGYNTIQIGGLTPSQYVASAGWIDCTILDTTKGVIPGDGVFYPNSRVAIGDITDGTHATLMVGERSPNVASAVWSGIVTFPDQGLCTQSSWPLKSCVSVLFLVMGRTGPAANIVNGDIPGAEAPNYPGAGADGFWSKHPGGCIFALCDGSVRFIKQSISPAIFRSLGSRSGGEVVSADVY